MEDTVTTLFTSERNVAPASFLRLLSADETAQWEPSVTATPEPEPQSAPEAEPAPVAPDPWAEREAVIVTELEAAHARGVEAGRAEWTEQLEVVQAQLAAALEQLAQAAEDLSKRARTEAVELGINVAQAIVGQTAAGDAQLLSHVLERALQAVPRTEEAVLKCNPDAQTRCPSG